jgi:hypothetical protein
MERQLVQRSKLPGQPNTAIEHRGNRRHRWRFPAATSHSFALDMLLSKGKIVQSSGATTLPASWCIFSGEGAPMCKRALAILTLVICSACALAQNESGAVLQGIDRNDLCVTNGNVSVLSGGWLSIDTPSSRAVVRADAKDTADQVAEIHFRYLGPTQTSKPLASGELRRQIGLKLQAEDTCNLIYAMWHIEPDTMVAVSVKRNTGMHTHEQCHAGGYVNIKAQRRIDLPPIRPGQTHTLRAELHGNDLTVTADGNVAWYGSLGDEPLSLQGPTGFRTDNARFEFQYYADPPADAQTRRGAPGPEHCVMSEGD